MRKWRENPESEENQRATKQSEREVFALKMQAKLRDGKILCHCGKPLNENGLCWDCDPIK